MRSSTLLRGKGLNERTSALVYSCMSLPFNTSTPDLLTKIHTEGGIRAISETSDNRASNEVDMVRERTPSTSPVGDQSKPEWGLGVFSVRRHQSWSATPVTADLVPRPRWPFWKPVAEPRRHEKRSAWTCLVSGVNFNHGSTSSRWRRLLAVETLAIDRWHDRTTGEDLRIPVNVIMEQSPVAWPLPFSDMLSWRSWPRAASLLQLRLSTIRTDSIQVIRTGLGSIVIKAELFELGSILIRSDDGADVGLGDLRVAVFFFLQSWIFEALGSIIRSWRRNFLWRSTAVGLLCDYGSRLLDRVRWWPPHMVSPEIVSNMKRWTVWWR